MFRRTRLQTGGLVLLALGVSLLAAVFASQSVNTAAGRSGNDNATTEVDPFATPAAAYTAFRQAQAALDWSSEYQCYSPRQQARFCHTIVVTALYLEFQTDLYLEVEAALKRHGLSDEDLEGFWPKTVYKVIDAAEPEDSHEDFLAEYEANLRRWQRDVVPKISDCAGLIATLQPLIREGARRLPESTVPLTVLQFEGYAYGRLQKVSVDGDEATGHIRVKSRFGTFVDLACCDEDASDTSEQSDPAQSPSKSRNMVLQQGSGLYCWMREIASDLQTLANSMQHPRMVIIGMPTGDVAVGPLQLGTDENGDISLTEGSIADRDVDVMAQVDYRDEGQEFDLANTGTRTVTLGEVKFQRFDGQWLIDSIDCR